MQLQNIYSSSIYWTITLDVGGSEKFITVLALMSWLVNDSQFKNNLMDLHAALQLVLTDPPACMRFGMGTGICFIHGNDQSPSKDMTCHGAPRNN